MAIEIQPRDLAILRHVFAHRVATYDQVHRKFFSQNFESVSRNRIRKLVLEGYLRTSVCERGQSLIRVLSLTEKTWPLISQEWDFDVDKPHFHSESVKHDFGLTEVAFKFEKLSSFVRFLPENLLQSSSELAADPFFRDAIKLQSDGVLVLNDEDGGSFVFAVEYEISKKAPDRYIKKLEAYYRVGGIDGVLYVCGNQQILDAVARADRQARTGNESTVFLNLEANVLKSETRIIFKGVDGGGIGLN